MIIYKVSISAGKLNMPYRIKEETIEVVETAKAYKSYSNLIKKSLFLKVDSIFINQSPASLYYHTYALEKDVNTAKGLLVSKCLDKLDIFKEQISLLEDSLLKR